MSERGGPAPRRGVVMVSYNFFPYIGGAEGQARALAGALLRRGVPVRVLTRRRPGLPSSEVLDGVLIRRLPAWGPGPLASLVFLAACFIHLAAHRGDYDVIHAHLASSPAVAAAAAGRLFGKRVVVKLGGGKGVGEIALSKRSLLGRLKLRTLALLGPILVAVNADLLSEMQGSGVEGLQTRVLPNGVDTERFRPASQREKAELRRELGWTDGFALLSTSRLDGDKGVDALLAEFLETWAQAAPESARVYIAGPGPAAQALEARAKALGARAEFLGPRADVEPLYRAADAFLLPSASEGLSNALLEAMACGLPALATRVSGTAGVVEDGANGLLYGPGRAEELRYQLGRLLSDAGLRERLSRAARATAERYSLEDTADRWLKLYGGRG